MNQKNNGQKPSPSFISSKLPITTLVEVISQDPRGSDRHMTVRRIDTSEIIKVRYEELKASENFAVDTDNVLPRQKPPVEAGSVVALVGLKKNENGSYYFRGSPKDYGFSEYYDAAYLSRASVLVSSIYNKASGQIEPAIVFLDQNSRSRSISRDDDASGVTEAVDASLAAVAKIEPQSGRPKLVMERLDPDGRILRKIINIRPEDGVEVISRLVRSHIRKEGEWPNIPVTIVPAMEIPVVSKQGRKDLEPIIGELRHTENGVHEILICNVKLAISWGSSQEGGVTAISPAEAPSLRLRARDKSDLLNHDHAREMQTDAMESVITSFRSSREDPMSGMNR